MPPPVISIGRDIDRGGVGARRGSVERAPVSSEAAAESHSGRSRAADAASRDRPPAQMPVGPSVNVDTGAAAGTPGLASVADRGAGGLVQRRLRLKGAEVGQTVAARHDTGQLP